jgi:hypothetical protein
MGPLPKLDPELWRRLTKRLRQEEGPCQALYRHLATTCNTLYSLQQSCGEELKLHRSSLREELERDDVPSQEECTLGDVYLPQIVQVLEYLCQT